MISWVFFFTFVAIFRQESWPLAPLIWINVREYQRCNQKKENPETLATYDTQDEEKQSKNTTQYVLDTTICKQTEITQIRQTTGGKDESNIVCYAEIVMESKDT
jgi:hypothetical protein